MNILAFETSCDDTCAAVVKAWGSKKKPRFKILSNIISSQVKIHQKYGGVYPFLAKREHQRNLPTVLEKALKKANFSTRAPKQSLVLGRALSKPRALVSNIDFIAVTVGPGLEPCLWTGVNFAKDLAKKWELPIVPINHIEAHIIANWLTPIGPKSKIKNKKLKIFPAICLVVSGGHTQLILMRGFRKYKILGETRDDAAGECFDKVARILNLGYPGGPAIANEASKFKTYRGRASVCLFKTYRGRASVCLPRPMIGQKNYDFSFSGLKTAVLYDYKSKPAKTRKSKEYIKAMAAETQQAVIDVLIRKTLLATRNYRVKTIVLGGGVASNSELRRQFKLKIKNLKLEIGFLVPPKKLCTDNAVMAAAAGYFHWPTNKTLPEEIEAKANLRI